MTKIFQNKHEKLLKKENNLKENLQNEATKTKEKLEKYWSITNNEIKNGDRILKGLKKIQKEDKIFRNLSYISKMNKTQKEFKNLLQQPIKNIKFFSQEENNNINYEGYYINGIPTPKDIEFQNAHNSLNITLKIDNLGKSNNSYKEMIYIVEMKKEGSEDNFKEVYKGNKKICFINDLKKYTFYEIRICTFYNGIYGTWSNTEKLKLLN